MRKTRRLPHILYNWLVVGLGFWLLAYIFPFLNLDLGREFLIMITLGVLAEWLAVVLPQGQLSGGFAVVLASFLIYGPVAAAWINGLSAALGQGVANRGNPLRTTLFNSAQYVLAVLGANFVYVTAGGAAGRGLDRANIIPLALFILSYFVINQFMVYFYTLPVRSGYPLFAWRDALRWDVLTYLPAVPFGLLMGLLYAETGIYGTALLFMPVLGVQFLLRYYVHLELVNRELRVLYEVARRLGGSLNLQEILDLVLRETRRVINYHTGIIYLWSDDKECYLAAAVCGPYAEPVKGSEVRPGEGFLGLAAENGDTLLVDDTREDVRCSGDTGLIQVVRSMVVVPLKAKTETLGLLVLGDKRPGFFEDKHLQTLTIFGGLAAVAAANARLYRKLERYEVTDGLTGLYGFPYFYRRAAEELERAGRYGDDLSMAVLDIDQFGRINDRYGHGAGDAVLALAGRVIREEVRGADLAARYGGGRFALLMPRTGPSEALHVVERLRLAVRECFFEVENRRIPVRLRTGIATYPEQAADLEALIKAAGSDLNEGSKRIP